MKIIFYMSKSNPKIIKKNMLSRFLIALTLLLSLVAVFEGITQNNFTALAPTQLFVVAGVFGILGLYTKE